MRQGNIVEYIDEGQIFSGCVLAVETAGSGSKTRESYRILNEKNRTLTISANKIINFEAGSITEKIDHAAIAARLCQLRDKRREMAAAVPLSDIRELLKLENETLWSPKDMAAAYYGDAINDDQLSAVVRSLHSKNPYFKRKDDYFYAVGDEDLQKYFQQLAVEKEKQEREAEFLKELSDLAASAFAPEIRSGFIKKYGARIDILTNFFIFPENTAFQNKGRELIQIISDGINARFDAFKFLVDMAIFCRDENFLLKKYNIDKKFEPKLIEEVGEFKKTFTMDKYKMIDAYSVLDGIKRGEKKFCDENSRVDLTNIASYTIDSADTKCCDDGISFIRYGDGYALMVHVADISEMIKEGTEIDSEAFARVTAIYMAEGKIDMIPEEVSNDLFSLRENERRLCLTLAAVLSSELEIINSAFVPSIIKVEKKCSYEQINEILSNGNGAAGITTTREELETLLKFSSVMRQRRETAGAVSLFFPKADIYVEDPGSENEKINISTDDHGEAGTIVSELMIFYNSRAAELFNAFKAPAHFKYSASYPSPELVKKYREDVPAGSYNPLRAWEIRRSMPYSISAYEMTPHGMLGVPGYVQASSPLRRYIDLLMQRQIKSLLVFGKPRYDIESLKEKIIYCEGSLSAASEIEQESRGYWLYKYLKKNSGEKIPATVIEASEDRFRVELSKYFLHLNGAARLHGKRTAGERVIVTINSVDIRDRKIHFAIDTFEE